MGNTGIGHDHGEIWVFKRNQSRFARLAVDHDKAVLLTEGRGKLVHDAAGAVGVVVLGFLAEKSLGFGVELDAGESL